MPIAGQKLPRYFEAHLEFFAKSKNFILFIPRILWGPLTMICGTLIGKRCPKNLLEKIMLFVKFVERSE
jgi:hypothetical protein